MIYTFKAEQKIKQPIKNVFDFFADATNLQTITPPLLNFKITTPAPIEMKTGTLIDYKLKIHGVPIFWKTRIELWEPPYKFIDNQLKGPYKLWHHTHEFKELSKSETLMIDTVKYQIPFGLIGQIANSLFVKSDVQKIFEFRRKIIDETFNQA